MPLLITSQDITTIPCDEFASVSFEQAIETGLPITEEMLYECYHNVLVEAEKQNCENLCIPFYLLKGVPKDVSMRAVLDAICEFLAHHEMSVYLWVHDKNDVQIKHELFSDVTKYIDHYYEERYSDVSTQIFPPEDFSHLSSLSATPKNPKDEQNKRKQPLELLKRLFGKQEELSSAIRERDESFSEMLLRKIDEKGLTDAECYRKANIDRKLFSKIRSNINYRPRKTTVVAFAIALELSLTETKELMQKAGFALNHSSVFDIIIEYFIVNGNYNIYEINEVLFAFDQSLLGS